MGMGVWMRSTGIVLLPKSLLNKWIINPWQLSLSLPAHLTCKSEKCGELGWHTTYTRHGGLQSAGHKWYFEAGFGLRIETDKQLDFGIEIVHGNCLRSTTQFNERLAARVCVAIKQSSRIDGSVLLIFLMPLEGGAANVNRF